MPLASAPVPTRLAFDAPASAKNVALIAIGRDVPRYNLLLPTAVNQFRSSPNALLDPKLVGLLDAIFKSAIAYLLLRPAGSRGAKGQQRTQAIVGLIEQIEAHAAFFRIKFLTSSFEEGEINYWLERANQNLMGPDVYKDFLLWVETTEKKAFEERHQELQSQLVYLGDLERARYEAHFDGRRIVNAEDQPITTMGTASFSGLQNANIYVCSARTRKIYTAESVAGQMHHSSFLAGEPIIAGGDWVVEAGRLRFINAASGHYRPTSGHMLAFLQLYSAHLDPEAWVQPTYKGPVYKIRDYLLKGEAARPDPEGQRFASPIVASYPITGAPAREEKKHVYMT